MQTSIPQELAGEIAAIARELDVDVENAIRLALEQWVAEHQKKKRRLPDPPFLDHTILTPCDLPRNGIHTVNVRQAASRLPDRIE
ncbi:MAG: hypothetical protein KDA60_02400, partial [Planctomycetales bacterium]|nr:hypothetical protein [Planctomycetales bacterium]